MIELYSVGNSKPFYKEELSILRYFRIDNLQLDNYILKVIPIGPKLYKYNASVTQLNLESDKDQIGRASCRERVYVLV